MAIKSEANSLSTTRELIYTSNNGHAEAPQGLEVWNNDASITIYVGGEDVTTANGRPVRAQSAVTIDLISGDEVYAIAASGTPEIRLLYTRV